MKLELEFIGLKELMQAVEKAATDSEIREINKNIIKKAQPIIEKEMKARIPKSKNHAKSGKWNKGTKSRETPAARAAEKIPIGKIKVKGTGAEGSVGWEKSYNGEHFYVKFVNWGTIRQPPQEFIYKAGRAADAQMQSIAEQEYQAYLDKTIG